MDLDSLFKTNRIDAVVIVHPDFLWPKIDYFQRFHDSLIYLKLPILIIPTNLENSSNLTSIFPRGVIPFDSYTQDCYIYPDCILEQISSLTGKRINELNLLFGGIFYSDCVASLANRICKKVYPRFPENFYDGEESLIKAREGYVCRDICVV